MRWTKCQQLLLAVIILLLAVCGARATVLAEQEFWSGLSPADAEILSGDE